MDMVKVEQVVVGIDEKNTLEDIKPSVVAPVPSYPTESLQCFDCLITFPNHKTKERHMRKSHREEYKRQLQENNTLFACFLCDKSFYSSDVLSQHQATHSPTEKPFVCTDCNKSFRTFQELSRHRGHECKERKYICIQCGAVFPSRSRLRRHRSTLHPAGAEDVHAHQCYKCCRCFPTEEELLQHLEIFANGVDCEKKRLGRKSKNTAKGGTVVMKKIKQEEDTGEYREYNDSKRKGCPSKTQPKELEIPCPEEKCDLVFPSVTALRAHKREKHGPAPCKH